MGGGQLVTHTPDAMLRAVWGLFPQLKGFKQQDAQVKKYPVS